MKFSYMCMAEIQEGHIIIHRDTFAAWYFAAKRNLIYVENDTITAGDLKLENISIDDKDTLEVTALDPHHCKKWDYGSEHFNSVLLLEDPADDQSSLTIHLSTLTHCATLTVSCNSTGLPLATALGVVGLESYTDTDVDGEERHWITYTWGEFDDNTTSLPEVLAKVLTTVSTRLQEEQNP